jgi:predicted nucleic acid-binding protein
LAKLDRYVGKIFTTTSIEPGVIDANILVYAINPESPQHAGSNNLLEAARDPAITLYVTSQIVCEFYSVITNPRRVAVPRPPADALTIISDLLAFPGLQVLPSPRGAVQLLIELLGVERSSAEASSTCRS